jgi:hypothetical protein
MQEEEAGVLLRLLQCTGRPATENSLASAVLRRQSHSEHRGMLGSGTRKVCELPRGTGLKELGREG